MAEIETKKIAVRKRSKAGLIAGLLLGGAALGGAIGVLYAPKSGTETRALIKSRMARKEPWRP